MHVLIVECLGRDLYRILYQSTQELSMRLSNRTIYGLRAVVDLAYHGDGEPTQVRQIADRGRIPIRFLEQIFQDLKKSGIVASKRGPSGGYILVASPETLTLAKLFDVLDDLPELPEVARDEQIEGAAEIADVTCRELVGRMIEIFEEITVADLVERGQKLGLARDGYEGFNYVI